MSACDDIIRGLVEHHAVAAARLKDWYGNAMEELETKYNIATYDAEIETLRADTNVKQAELAQRYRTRVTSLEGLYTDQQGQLQDKTEAYESIMAKLEDDYASKVADLQRHHDGYEQYIAEKNTLVHNYRAKATALDEKYHQQLASLRDPFVSKDKHEGLLPPHSGKIPLPPHINKLRTKLAKVQALTHDFKRKKCPRQPSLKALRAAL